MRQNVKKCVDWCRQQMAKVWFAVMKNDKPHLKVILYLPEVAFKKSDSGLSKWEKRARIIRNTFGDHFNRSKSLLSSIFNTSSYEEKCYCESKQKNVQSEVAMEIAFWDSALSDINVTSSSRNDNGNVGLGKTVETVEVPVIVVSKKKPSGKGFGTAIYNFVALSARHITTDECKNCYFTGNLLTHELCHVFGFFGHGNCEKLLPCVLTGLGYDCSNGEVETKMMRQGNYEDKNRALNEFEKSYIKKVLGEGKSEKAELHVYGLPADTPRSDIPAAVGNWCAAMPDEITLCPEKNKLYLELPSMFQVEISKDEWSGLLFSYVYAVCKDSDEEKQYGLPYRFTETESGDKVILRGTVFFRGFDPASQQYSALFQKAGEYKVSIMLYTGNGEGEGCFDVSSARLIQVEQQINIEQPKQSYKTLMGEHGNEQLAGMLNRLVAMHYVSDVDVVNKKFQSAREMIYKNHRVIEFYNQKNINNMDPYRQKLSSIFFDFYDQIPDDLKSDYGVSYQFILKNRKTIMDSEKKYPDM